MGVVDADGPNLIKTSTAENKLNDEGESQGITSISQSDGSKCDVSSEKYELLCATPADGINTHKFTDLKTGTEKEIQVSYVGVGG